MNEKEDTQETKSGKKSETKSEEEFFDTVIKEAKREVPVEIKMASENKGFMLQAFDGTHYDKWKYKLKLFLEFKECSVLRRRNS